MDREKLAKEVLGSNLKDDTKVELLRILFQEIQYIPQYPIYPDYTNPYHGLQL